MHKRVYFHIVDPALGKRFHPVYQYDYIPLAQGLIELGYQIFSNRDYWHGLSGKPLFKHSPEVSPLDCELNVFSGLCLYYNYKIDDNIFRASHTRTVLIEQNDGFFTPLFYEISRKFDCILHKKSQAVKYPENCVSSWTFGISNEMMEIASLYTSSFEERSNEILCNFRYGHTVRNYALSYLSKLQLKAKINTSTDEFDFDEYAGTRFLTMLEENGGRHRPTYMERLSGVKVCATFGGYFFFRHLLDKNPFTYRLGNYLLPERAGGTLVNVIKKLRVHKNTTNAIYQWDSWRYWEAYVCGCVNLNVDFEYYGIELPIMPVKGQHYIGVNFDKSEKYNEDMLNLSDAELNRIADNGKQWAIENYSPVPIAKRFLHLVSQNQSVSF